MFCVQCGKENPDIGAFCWKCGNQLFKAESKAQAPPSESPATAPPTTPAMRNGKKLIFPNGAGLPAVCVKCGASGIYHSYKLAWIEPAYFALFYLGIAPYFIVRLFLRKTVRLSIPLCARHRRQTRTFGWVGVLTLVAAIPAGYGTYAALGDVEGGIWGFFVAFFLLIIALILLWAHYPLRAVRIDKNCAVFEGADETFLKLLPSSTEPTQQR